MGVADFDGLGLCARRNKHQKKGKKRCPAQKEKVLCESYYHFFKEVFVEPESGKA